MIKKKFIENKTPYIQFSRKKWESSLSKFMPMFLSKYDVQCLKSINKTISIKEVIEIYLPLSKLLNFYIHSNMQYQSILKKSLKKNKKIPYIISIAGSVAVGKSTLARVLQFLLSRFSNYPHVELIATDGFLHPNKILKRKGLMEKKGFPQSYNIHRLVNFLSALKSGKSKVFAPIYSHLHYDIIEGLNREIYNPDILILEGLNVLQTFMDYPKNSHRVFISDFVDFSIYVHASEVLLKSWFINRFLNFRQDAFSNPNSYFHSYTNLSNKKAKEIAFYLWKKINFINLKKNIFPTRKRANLIIIKSKNHIVKYIKLRK